jgi:putative two-component system response regulator
MALVLQSMAEIMKSSFRSSDILGRVGGDEFVIFLKNIESAPTVLECVDAMRKRTRPVRIDEKDAECLPVFSTGISLYPQHGKTYNEIFRRADAAMYYIKSHGKDGVKLYDETMDSAK